MHAHTHELDDVRGCHLPTTHTHAHIHTHTCKHIGIPILIRYIHLRTRRGAQENLFSGLPVDCGLWRREAFLHTHMQTRQRLTSKHRPSGDARHRECVHFLGTFWSLMYVFACHDVHVVSVSVSVAPSRCRYLLYYCPDCCPEGRLPLSSARAFTRDNIYTHKHTNTQIHKTPQVRD